MKKCKVLHIIGVMTICTMLGGCGAAHQTAQSDERVEEVTSQDNQDNQDKQDAAASPETEDMEIEDTEIEETGAEVETDTNVPESDTEEAPSEFVYQELLDSIYDLILAEDMETDHELAAQVMNGILEAGYSQTPEETLEHIGYALWDINTDGMPELVIGGISEERDGTFFGRDIYAVYTCVQEELYCICSGWARNYVGWMGENVFYNLGSGGAAYTAVGQYELLPNAKEWSCIELYFTDENGIYHNQTGIYDNEYAEALDMTENEFWELDDELYNRVLEFELTPFSTYTCFGDN